MQQVYDLGVVLALCKTAAVGFYTDRENTSRNAVALSTSYQGMNTTTVPTAAIRVGAEQSLVLRVQAVLDGADSLSFAVMDTREEGKIASGVTWLRSGIAIGRLDGTGSLSVVQTIVAADLLEPDGATACDLGYGATAQKASGKLVVIGKATGAIGNNTKLIVAVSVL